MSQHLGNLPGETSGERNGAAIATVAALHGIPRDGDHSGFYIRSAATLHETEKAIDDASARLATEAARRLLDDKN